MEACAGSTWGAIASDIQNAPGCVRGCRDSLRRLLAPNDETYEDLCSTLVQLDEPRRNDMLVGLYCCDAQLCGVDNIALPGFDPNVDYIINVCQSLGFASIRDPGPPAAVHVCVNTLLPSSDITCSRTTIFTTTTSSYLISQTTTALSSATPTRTDTETTTTLSLGGTTRIPTSTTMTSTSETGPALPSISSLEDPGLTKNVSGGARDDGTGGLSTAAKIIIAAAVSGAILVALIAVLWHCRYRRKNKQSETPNDVQPNLALARPSEGGSHASPLVSPSPSFLGPDGAPLTPPLRLNERRLLATGSSERLLDNRPSRLRPGFHLPISSRAGGASPGGPVMTPAFATVAAVERRPSAPSSPNPSRAPLSSPTRSQFSQGPYSPSLISPGPPPDRELPSTPVRAAAAARARSRSRTNAPSPDAIGVALEFPPQEPAQSRQTGNGGGAGLESRVTSGAGGGGWSDSWVVSEDGERRNLAPPAMTKRGTSRSPILEERELERMAGSY